MTTLSTITEIPLTPDEDKIRNWLGLVATQSHENNDVSSHFLSLIAFNCLTGCWINSSLVDDTYHIHAADPYWKADADWFGTGFADKVTTGPNGLPQVELQDMREALGCFSMFLFERFSLLLVNLNKSVQDIDEIANDNWDIDLLVKLEIFTPVQFLVKDPQALDKKLVTTFFDETIRFAQDADWQARVTSSQEFELELGHSTLLSMAAAAIFLGQRFYA